MHADRHAIITLTRCRAVIHGIAFTLVKNFIRKPIDAMMLQLLVHHRSQSGDQALFMLRQPLVKCCRRMNFLRDALFAIRDHRIFIPHAIGSSQLVLDRAHFFTQLVDEIQKPPTLSKTTAQQSLAHKHRMSEFPIDPAIMHPTSIDDRKSTAHDPLLAVHRSLALIPPGLTIHAATQMRRDLFDPLGINPRHPPRPQARGLDQLHCHHPLPTLRRTKQSRSGKHRKKSARRTAIRLVFPIPQTELPRHSRQQRSMNRRIWKMVFLRINATLQMRRLAIRQFVDDICPLDHTPHVEIGRRRKFPQGIAPPPPALITK